MVVDMIFVMAGEFIVQLQTVVSRQENRRDPTVVTVGSIHGGTKRNATAAGRALPGPHTSNFEPVAEATLRTGVTAMSCAAIALLQ